MKKVNVVKYEIIEMSDCRWVSEVYSIWDIVSESGRDVFNYIIEREKKDENWVEYVCDMVDMDESEWIDNKEIWSSLFFVEGKLDKDVFEICMNDELRSIMVIREDSEYFGKFDRDVDNKNEENSKLYLSIWEKLI